jgi:hypothetical protein
MIKNILVVLALLSASNTFADNIASLNHVFSLDGFSFKTDGTPVADLVKTWDLASDAHGATYTHRAKDDFEIDHKVRIDKNYSGNIEQLTAWNKTKGATAQIRGNKIFSVTSCQTSCKTVTRSFCTALYEHVKAKDATDFRDKIAACEKMQTFKPSDAVIQETKLAETENVKILKIYTAPSMTSTSELNHIAESAAKNKVNFAALAPLVVLGSLGDLCEKAGLSNTPEKAPPTQIQRLIYKIRGTPAQ